MNVDTDNPEKNIEKNGFNIGSDFENSVSIYARIDFSPSNYIPAPVSIIC